MIDPRDRVLLLRLKFDDWTGWVLPGGGIEPGEDHRTALLRELAEETGVPQPFIGPPVWNRRHVFSLGDYDGQEETAYLVPCHRFEVAPSMTAQELRSEGVVEHRWWTVDELASTGDEIRPVELHRHLAQVLEFGAPERPIQIDETSTR
jgi:8-oxo-dGTP pyrophosphatase MutT (NUDIX family)